MTAQWYLYAGGYTAFRGHVAHSVIHKASTIGRQRYLSGYPPGGVR